MNIQLCETPDAFLPSLCLIFLTDIRLNDLNRLPLYNMSCIFLIIMRVENIDMVYIPEVRLARNLGKKYGYDV